MATIFLLFPRFHAGMHMCSFSFLKINTERMFFWHPPPLIVSLEKKEWSKWEMEIVIDTNLFSYVQWEWRATECSFSPKWCFKMINRGLNWLCLLYMFFGQQGDLLPSIIWDIQFKSIIFRGKFFSFEVLDPWISL